MTITIKLSARIPESWRIQRLRLAEGINPLTGRTLSPAERSAWAQAAEVRL